MDNRSQDDNSLVWVLLLLAVAIALIAGIYFYLRSLRQPYVDDTFVSPTPALVSPSPSPTPEPSPTPTDSPTPVASPSESPSPIATPSP